LLPDLDGFCFTSSPKEESYLLDECHDVLALFYSFIVH